MQSRSLREPSTIRIGVPLLLTLTLSAAAQTTVPAISPGGLVNAASYTETVAPGSIAAVFGDFLLTAPAQALAVPLPTSLSDVYMQFDGAQRAPLFYVSGGQVNIQIPWELAGRSQAALTVTANGQTSAPRTASLAQYAPAIFNINGRGVIQDASFRLIDPSNPAAAGRTTIVIYCTGLGPVTNQPPSGAAGLAIPLSETPTTPAVTVGGVPAKVDFSGLVPGLVGVYQVNAATPVGAPAGDATPVVISIGGATSNTVTMAVRAPDPDQGANALITQMTLDEKLQLVHGALTIENGVGPRGAVGWVPGIPRLGIPELLFADGGGGMSQGSVGPATALPSSIASAASWDLDQAYKWGRVIGAETRAYGINVSLLGNINLTGREPRDGRTFETAGEDPILAGKIKAAHVRAVQDEHVIGQLKHYAFNDQETGRTVANSIIGERAARESDLLAFEIAIKDSNAQAVMCSYNLVNGVYACQNDHLLNGILKGDWGFQGFVVTDWYAAQSSVTAALAGLDQEQPGGYLFGGAWAPSLSSALTSGQMPMSRLDNMVHRVLRAMLADGLFDHPSVSGTPDAAAGAAAAQEALEQGAVLLKNAAGQLPLDVSKIGSIAVIGSHADVGVLSGGGSAQVTPIGGAALTLPSVCPPTAAGLSGLACHNSSQIFDPSSPLAAIRAKAPGVSVQYNDGTNPAAAAARAQSSSVAIVFVSRWESEGMDLADLNFPDNQDALVSAVAAANPRTIVVMENGGPVLTPWLAEVGAVLEAWYPGQRGGEAIANLLFGSVNPSGKLPLTFPASVADLPRPGIPAPPDPNASTPFPVNYTEGFNVGYKWYDANHVTPLFPFGFGLSYTTFSFSNMSLSPANPNFQATFDLTNTGSLAGAEVAQVYLGFPAGIGEPPRRLVGWTKVFLQPGERRRVTIAVDNNDSSHPLSYWDVISGSWQVAPGDYTVYVGNSSSLASLTVAGTFHIRE
jgi:beta-glucosidase